MHRPFIRYLIFLLCWLSASTLLGAERKVTFVHINDVYELQPRNGLGGFAYLATLLDEYRKNDPHLIFTFGGDLLSPSLLSGMTQGAQLIEATNAVGMDVAVPGNHEFDFGPENMIQQLSASKTVWLTSNIRSQQGELMPGTRRNLLRDVQGTKVGFFGVITPTTAETSNAGTWTFLPVIETAQKEVAELKAQGAEVIVALTHLDLTEDRQLAAQVKGIHLILGGHDHDPVAFYENGTLIMKSSSDDQFVSSVELTLTSLAANKPPKWLPSWKVRPVIGLPAKPEIQSIVDRWQLKLDEALGKTLFTVTEPFSSLESDVRTRESGLGNMIVDAIRERMNANIAIVNGGGLRGNRTYSPGYAFSSKDILTELPFGNVVVLVEISGKDIMQALENGVSQVETSGGSFAIISGMSMTYDPGKPAGQRILDVKVGNTPLYRERHYTLATTDYLYSGKDGYGALKQGKLLIDPSSATLITNHIKEWLTTHQDWVPKVEGRVVAKSDR